MTNLLLGLIVALLLWAYVFRDPVMAAIRSARQSRRVIAGGIGDDHHAVLPQQPLDEMTIRMCDEHGKLEHETMLQTADAPETVTYHGKVYTQEKRVHLKAPHEHEVVWEYRR